MTAVGFRSRLGLRERMLDGVADVTQILNAIERGDPTAAADLLPLVYDELRRLAASRVAEEKPGQTLQATALVHEAYVRLVGGEPSQPWDGRGHFFAAAAEAMRRILIDRVRHKNTRKAGGGHRRVDLDDLDPALDEPNPELILLDDALRELEQRHPRKAEVVKLRFFAGLTTAQAAAALGVSTSTAENDWAYARSWLRLRMGDPDRDQP
jgi:RNA polymerase sigma factor (TIGR02999 family)